MLFMPSPDREHPRHVKYPKEYREPFERIVKKSAYGEIDQSNVNTSAALFKKASHQNSKGQERESNETEAKAQAQLHHKLNTTHHGTRRAYERSIERWQRPRPRKKTIFQWIGELFS